MVFLSIKSKALYTKDRGAVKGIEKSRKLKAGQVVLYGQGQPVNKNQDGQVW
jgi:hypothetical protein